MINRIASVFASFGFAPIDTPALEYAEILLGKGSEETDKQLYRFKDQGDRDVALRFDLTVPLARFAAMHINELGTPFRRFHIAPVWRAEKPQRGRYREFIQCDFDIIGTTSVLADAEIVLLTSSIFKTLGVPALVRVNNRRVLNGFLESLNAREHSTSVLRAIDKLDKLGTDVVASELREFAKLNDAQIKSVFAFLELSSRAPSNVELLSELRSFLGKSELGLDGVSQLESVNIVLSECGLDDNNFRVDLAIARGLDYYTGTVLETSLVELPDIGSVCSGGRYDDLASLYTTKHLPGVGASVGLDRLLAAFEELKRLPDKSSTAEVLVTLLDAGTEGKCMSLASFLRAEGFAVEMYPELGRLGGQFKYADKKGIEFVIIAGAPNLQEGRCEVKHLSSGEQSSPLPFADVAPFIQRIREQQRK